MKKLYLKPFVLIFLCLFSSLHVQAQRYFYSIANANWSSSSAWAWSSTDTRAAATAAGNVGNAIPGSGTNDFVRIGAFFTITMDISPANTIQGIVINDASTGNLTIGTGTTPLTLSIGTSGLTNNSTGFLLTGAFNAIHTINLAGNFVNQGTSTMYTSATRGINLVMNGTTQSITKNSLSLNNLTINNGSTTTTDVNNTINGSLSVSGTYTIGASASNKAIVVTGGISVTNTGTINIGAFNATHSINTSGNLTNNGVITLYNNASQVANFTFSAGPATIGGNSAITFAGLSVISSVSVTVANSFTTNGTLTINSNATFQLDATGTARSITVNAGGSINGGANWNMASPGTATTHSITFAGGTFNCGGTVNFVNGNNIADVTITGTSVTLSGATYTLNNISSSGTVSVNFSGTYIIGKVLTIGNNTSAAFAANFTFNGAGAVFINNGSTSATSGSLFFAGGTTQTISGNATTLFSLQVSPSSGSVNTTLSLSTSIVLNGSLTLLSGQTMLGNGNDITVFGSFNVNSGSIFTASSGSSGNFTVSTTGSSGFGGGSGTSNITFNNFIMNGTGNFTISTGAPTTINGNFTVSSGTITFAHSNSFSIKGNIVNNATTTATTNGAITFTGTTQTISGTPVSTGFWNLLISSGSTVTTSIPFACLMVSSTNFGLDILNGGTFNQGNNDVSLKGGFRNSNTTGGLTQGTGSIVFNGIAHSLSIPNGASAIPNIVLSGSSFPVVTRTFGNLAITNLTIGTGCVFDFNGTNTHTVTNLYGPGTIRISINGSGNGTVAVTNNYLAHTTGAQAGTYEFSNVSNASNNYNVPALAASLSAAANTYYNLTFSGTFTKTLTAGVDILVNGTLNINSGCTVTAQAGRNITLTGPSGTGANWICNGTFNPSTGTVIFNNQTSGASQSIGGTTSTFNNLTIDKAGTTNGGVGFSSGAAASVAGTFALNSDGYFNINSSSLTMGTAATFSGTFSANRNIQFDGTINSGYLIKQGTAIANFVATYPVGTSSTFSPMQITSLGSSTVSGTAQISLRVINQTRTNALSKYWELTPSGFTTYSNIQLNFTYNAAEVSGTEASYITERYENNQWNTVTGSFVNTTNKTFGVNTTGNNSISGNWTVGISSAFKATLYSYINGDWNTSTTWTTDPSGNTLTGSSVPGTSDNVIILAGRTVTVSTSSLTVSSVTLNSTATLDLASTSGHSFGTLSGSGSLRLSSAILPSGNYTAFVAATGGTIEYYGSSLTLPSGRTTYNNLLINLTSGQTATTLSSFSTNGTFTLSSGNFRINDNSATTALVISIAGDATIASGCSLTVGQGNTNNSSLILGSSGPFYLAGSDGSFGNLPNISGLYHQIYHQLSFSGNFSNNGTCIFTNQTQPHYWQLNGNSGTTSTTTGCVSVYFKGNSNNTATLNGQTDFYNLIIDKGVDATPILTMTAPSSSNFRLFGPILLAGFVGSNAATPEIRKALYLKTGTLKLQGAITIPALTEGNGGSNPNGDYYIPANSGLWIDGATVNNTCDATANTTVGGVTAVDPAGLTVGSGSWQGSSSSFSIYGTLRISSGTFNTNSCGGLIFWTTAPGQILVEGGTLNATQIRTAGTASGLISFTQTGGTTNLLGRQTTFISGITSTAGTFSLQVSTASFVMSGGQMNILDIATNLNGNNNTQLMAFEYLGSAGNYSVTGGNIEIITNGVTSGSFTNYGINSTAPFYNLKITRGSSATANVVVTANPQVSGQTVNPLVVNNNLTIGTVSGASNITLDANGNNVTIGGNLVVGGGSSPGTLTCGAASTLTFNGTAAQSFQVDGTLGTIGNLSVTNTSAAVTLSGSANSINITGGLTTAPGSVLADGGKTLNIGGNILHSGSHTGSGKITLNSSSASQTIGGGGGTFNNLELNNTSGSAGTATVSLTAAQTVNGTLTLTSARLFDLTTFNLALASGASISGSGLGTTQFIKTSGNASDGGLSLTLSGNGPIVFPVGTGTNYTPATLTLSSAPTTYGSITVIPVPQKQPNVTGTNALPYYWKVKSSGFTGLASGSVNYVFNYGTATPAGTVSLYIPGSYNPFAWTAVGNFTLVNSTTKNISFNNLSFATADFTAGESSAFGTVTIYYSMRNGDWFNTAAGTTPWSTTGPTGPEATGVTPTANSPVIIGDGGSNNHTITFGTSSATAGSLQLNSGSTLDLGSSTGHNFQTVTATPASFGTVRISSSAATAQFPGGDFSNFLASGAGTVEYYNSGAVNFRLPSTSFTGASMLSYNNLTFTTTTGNTISLPDANFSVLGNFNTQGTGTSVIDNAAARTLSITGNLNVLAGTTQIKSNGFNQTVSVTGNTTVSAGATFSTTAGTASTHSFTTAGNFTINGPGTTVNFSPGTSVVNLTFTGTNNTSLTGTGASTVTLNNMVVNKGTSQTPVLNVDVAGTLTLPTGFLTLTNGTFRLAKASQSITLSTTSSFTIPATACLSVNSSSATINIGNAANSAGDLLLQGKLELLNGTINVGPSVAASQSKDNDIEYASTGSPEINISGSGTSTLLVVGQIRRSTSNPLGSLVYNHSGTGNNTLTILGINQNNTRGTFEILNTGSQFNMSGANSNITIARTNASSLISDVYLFPSTSTVTGGTLTMGIGTAGTQTFDLQSNINLYNLTVNGATSNVNTVRIEGKPLVLLGNLTLNNSSSILDAATNNLDVTVGGNFVNNGAAASYLPGSNTTTLNGASGQISGTATTTFNKLTISGAITLASASPNFTVNNTFTVGSGNSFTLNGSTKAFTKASVVNNGSILGTGTFSLNGTGNQSLSGTGTYNNLELNNTSGATLNNTGTNINGTITFSAGILDIGSNNLVLGTSVSISGTPDNTKLIRTNGSTTDAGITKNYPASASNFTFPIGSGGKYTPAQFNVTANAATGTITVIPVNSVHPGTVDPASTSLSYYWNVSSTGFSGLTVTQSYTFDATDINGSVSSYFTGRYFNGVWTPLLGIQYSPSSPTLSVNSASNTINLVSVNYLNGGYTAGYSSEFGSPTTFYSRISGSRNWTNTTDAWSTDAILQHTGAASGLYPTAGNNAIIANGHTINADINSISVASLTVNGTLDLSNTLSHTLGTVSGAGTIKIQPTNAGSLLFPGGNFSGFTATGGGTVEYYGSVNATLPSVATYNGFTKSGSNTLTIPNLDLTFNGDLTINGGVLNNGTNSRSLTLGGSFYNNSSTSAFVKGSGSNALLTFNGTTDANLGGSFANSLVNVTINKLAGNVTLTSPLAISSSLTLTSGVVNTTNTNLITMAAAAATSAGSTGSYINGPIAQTGTGNKIFPVGSGTSGFYRKAVLNITSGTNPVVRGTLLSNVVSGFDVTLKHVSYFGWDMSLISGTFSAGTITVSYNASADNANSAANLRVAYGSNSSSIASAIGPAAGASAGTLTSNSFSTLGFFRLGSTTENNLLPLGLMDFKARRNGLLVNLAWQTVNESEMFGFDIEVSDDGKQFKRIGFVNAHPQSGSVNNYAWTDTVISAYGISYFRLKMVDMDGAFRYSTVVSLGDVEEVNAPFVLIFPNPHSAGEDLGLDLTNFNQSGTKTVEIITAHGIKTGIISSENVIDLRNRAKESLQALKAGTYLLKFTDEDSIVVKRFVKY